MPEIGIISGTAVYEISLEDSRVEPVDTPFGSVQVEVGRVGDVEVAYLPRHGRHHEYLPHEINYRANVYAMKKLGVRRLIAPSSVGSLSQNIKPGDIVVPDQLIDLTRRAHTFFGDRIGAYVSMEPPFCSHLSDHIIRLADNMGLRVGRGTYLCVSGPQFSTAAESQMYQLLGGAVIGMTIGPEAKLAREAEMCYSVVAAVADVNACGMTFRNPREEMARLMELRRRSVDLIPRLVEALDDWKCSCERALEGAIVTAFDGLSKERLEDLSYLLEKYEILPGKGAHGTRLLRRLD